MSLARTVTLACRRCGGERPVDAAAALVACHPCGEAIDVDGGVYPLRHAGTRGFADARALPFYRFGIDDAGLRVTSEAGEAGRERLSRLAVVWVIGVRIQRFQEQGDVSYEYTRRPPRLEAGEPAPTLAVVRTPADAARIARVLLWRWAAECCPPGTFELSPGFATPEIWCVRAAESDGLVKLPHCPIRYPADAIEGWRRSAV